MTKQNKKQKPPRNQTLNIVPSLMDIFKEMDSPDNRTTAIVGAALVENNLALALLSRLHIVDESEQKRLFDDPGAVLSSFAAKIDMGFVLNLYGKEVRADLNNIRLIRNGFAHHLEIRDFEHPEIAIRCDGLNGPKYLERRPTQKPRTKRDCFTDTVAHLAARFSLELKQKHMPPDPIARITPDY